MLQVIIFTTGAAILALELLASRIMTPYFGVSLYIWSGILSITLAALALGYWLGGRLAAGHKNRPVGLETLTFMFALMPVLAAFAIVGACLAYPHLFHQLARFHLIAGAFIACVVLLLVPLLATSAMNPLLVAILLHRPASAVADAGAGRVFFISTIGSVAGVAVTTFVLISHFSNFVSMLIVAATLGALPLVLMLDPRIKLVARKRLCATGTVAFAASLGLIAAADAYIERMWPAELAGTTWTREAVYRSMFGTIKILRSAVREDGDFLRIFFQDGLAHNIVDSDNQSTSMFSYAMEALGQAYRPEAREVLVLGNGAGVIPMSLVAREIAVTTVEIDPAALQAATEIFGFDPREVRTLQGDARTFLHSCNGEYRLVMVDMFHGDGVPDYLVTREFFRDLRRCMDSRGVAVFNTFADLGYESGPYAHFLATLRSELPFFALYRPDFGAAGLRINSYIVASARELPEPQHVDASHVPARYSDVLSRMLAGPQLIREQFLRSGHIITDASNPAAFDFASHQLRNRSYLVERLPAAFFVD